MIIVLSGMSSMAIAAKVSGVTLDENVSVQDVNLVLNGAGVRKKLFIKLYVGSLYIKQKSSDANAIMMADEPMMIRMNLLSQFLTREKLIKAIETGFRKSAGEKLPELQPKLDQFLSIVPEQVKPGDEYALLYSPDAGTSLIKDDKLLGAIEGLDFKQSLFGLWLSKTPVQSSLKKAMTAAN